jgi:hypothetical protein
MATFEAQVEGLTSLTISSSGTSPTQTELTQFLTDGAKEVINSLPGHLLPLCATSQSFTSGTVDKLNTGKILNVFRSDGDINQPCRKIPAKQKGRVSDPEDMAYATITDPIYYIDNNSLDVLPAGGSCTYSEVQYPAVAYSDSTITESTVTGITATKANPAVFTASSHGFSVNDILELSSFTEMSELNDITAKVASVPSANTFTLTGIDSSNYGAAETTGATAVKSTGFPDEAEHLVVLYGSVKSIQNVLGSRSSNSDITTAFGLLKDAVDQAATAASKFEEADSDSIFGDEDVFDTSASQLTRVKDALNNAEKIIDDGANSPTGNAAGDAATYLYTDEDTELLNGAINIARSEIQRAQVHIQEWTAIGDMRVKEINAALSEAQGYANEIQARLQVDSAQYGWYEKQQAKLQADYDKGLQALG